MSGDNELPASRRQLLEIWGTAISQTPSGTTVELSEENKRDEIRERTEAFLENPSPDRFEEMWRTGYAAGRVVASTPMQEKWTDEGRAMDDLVDLSQDSTPMV
jgi:hypothetical protein